MWRLRTKSNVPPKGFRWIDPITTFQVSAPNHPTWLTLAIEHRVGNALPLPREEDMEDQLCLGFTERVRCDVCEQFDGESVIRVLGVGSTLKEMLAYAGIHSCWSCTRLAERMDSWGPTGCEEHMAEIVETMNENANQRKWMKYVPFKEMGAEALVRLAIHKVRAQT